MHAGKTEPSGPHTVRELADLLIVLGENLKQSDDAPLPAQLEKLADAARAAASKHVIGP